MIMFNALRYLRWFRLPVMLLALLALPRWSSGQILEQEPNDTRAQATQLMIPISYAAGQISSASDVDYFKFRADAGAEFVIWLRTGDLEAIIALYNSEGILLAYNDREYNFGFGGPAVDPILYLKLPATAEYFIAVSSRDKFLEQEGGQNTGSYTMELFPRFYWSYLADIYEPNDSRATATSISLPFDSYICNLNLFGDTDWYRFYGKGGERVSIDIEALEPGSHDDWPVTAVPRVGIFDESGHLLQETVAPAEDPDNGFGEDPAMIFRLPRDGTYYVGVASVPDTGYGSVFNNEVFLDNPYVSSTQNMIGFYLIRVRSMQSLFFPQIASGSFGSVYFATSILLVNPTGNEMTGLISFYDGSGAQMPVPTSAGGEPSATYWFQIPPRGEHVLMTDSAGPGITGYATVQATGSIGGSVIFSEYGSSGELMTEAAVGSSVPMDFFTFPVDIAGEFNTGMALANAAETTPANIYLSLLDLYGNPVASRSITLEPGQQMAMYVSGLGQLFPGVKNFRGSLEVLSDTPIPAVALRCSSGTMTTFPTVSLNQSYEAATLHFPQVVVGPAGTYRTTIVLTNPGYFPVSGTLSLSAPIQFTSSSGGTLIPRSDSPPDGAAYDIAVPAKGTLFLESMPTAALTAGYAVLRANHGLGGVVIFSQFSATGRLLTEAAVPPAPLSEEFLIFAQTDAGYNTGVAMANITSTTVEVGFLIHAHSGPDDNLEGTPVLLEGGQHKAELISGENQLFPGFSGTGTLEVQCVVPMPAVALRLTATTMTAVPVIPIVK